MIVIMTNQARKWAESRREDLLIKIDLNTRKAKRDLIYLENMKITEFNFIHYI